VLVLGGITTADVAAFQAQAQMNPGIAGFHAFLANMLGGGGDADLVQVSAL
jgi:hypothetical protein